VSVRPPRPVVGAILAGGQSSRMGTDKAHVVIDGLSMREHVRRALWRVCDDVVIVGGDDATVVDPHQGPLVALLALVRAFPGRALIVAPVDQPRLDERALRPLLAACIDDDHAVVSWHDEPLPMGLGSASARHIESVVARGERRLLAAVTRQLPLDDDDVRRALVNVNTPSDLAALSSSPSAET
jgi:molybdenum cofactor guanylyltransferase